MRKIWTIVWKDLYLTFTDLNLLLLMFVTPLALATIISLAFGDLDGGTPPVKDIPVAVVNLDEGDFGAIFVAALVESEDGEAQSSAPSCGDGESSDDGDDILLQLTDAEAVSDPDLARAGVDDGDYTAAIIIPADFSQRIAYDPISHPEIEAAAVEVYANEGNAVSASIIRSIVEGFTARIATGNIAIAATLEAMQQRISLVDVGPEAGAYFAEAFGCAYSPDVGSIDIDQQTVTGESTASTRVLVFFGSAQAMFFMLFSAQGSAGSVLQEQNQWTLQRLSVSPTPRAMILLGKLMGTLVMAILQFTILAISLTIIGSLIAGEVLNIWGTNYPALVALILAAGVSVSGVGAIIASAIKSLEQQQVIGSIINMALAGLGGGFGFQLPATVAQFSLIYWGREAFGKLAEGESDILLHLVILLVQGTIMFLLGLWLFNRRFDE